MSYPVASVARDASAPTTNGHVQAVGGTRTVPAPDPIAREYLLLGLRLDQHLSGVVDGYLGPADLKAQVDLEPLRRPDRMVDDATSLRDRLPREVADPGRRAWLDAQLVALETMARQLAGESLPYLTVIERCLGVAPVRRPDALFEAATRRIDELLPGPGTAADRLAAWDESLTVPTDRLPDVAAWLIDQCRERARETFGLPEDEWVRLGLVGGRPWVAYCWYEGGRRSRIDLSTELPVRAPDLLATIAHETYPGHHLERAWKEATLVDDVGRLEVAIQLVNTPECLMSEGLADAGVRFAAPAEVHADLLVEVFRRAGLPVGQDPVAAREAADRAVALTVPRAVLEAVGAEVAIRRHVDGLGDADALAMLREVGQLNPERAAKRIEFIDHPTYRTYLFAYTEGEPLVSAWLDAGRGIGISPESRFDRLLRETLTPSAIRAGG